jgi:hypothetical protein
MIDTFIEIRLKEDGDFLKVKETLTRIGIPHTTGIEKPSLLQSCHILHKRGKFYVVHFKELYALDEERRKERGIVSNLPPTVITEEDIARRNTIAAMLETWGLVEIINPAICEKPRCHMYNGDTILIKVLPYKEKEKWNLKPKYIIGRKKHGGRDNN